MTREEVQALGKAVAAALKPLQMLCAQTALAAVQTDLRNKETALSVAALVDAPRMVYRGTYSETDTYYLGNFVTHRGCVWHCDAQQVSDVAPGDELTNRTNTRAWTLAVKRGSRGKSASHDTLNGEQK